MQINKAGYKNRNRKITTASILVLTMNMNNKEYTLNYIMLADALKIFD